MSAIEGRMAHFAAEGVTVSIPPQADGVEYRVVQEALGLVVREREGTIRAIREVISFRFEREDGGDLPSRFDPPAEVQVVYTPADWRSKRAKEQERRAREGQPAPRKRDIKLELRKYNPGTREWDPFPRFERVADEETPDLGGLGVVKIEDPGDPRIGWY